MNGPAVLEMWWRDIATAHWRADASVLSSMLPRGLALDRFEGDAWLSVVPFRMTDVRVRFSPVLPGFADVPELNLRTYVRAGNVLGIFFFSLDAGSRVLVRAARLGTGLPYRNARIVTGESDAGITFASERTHRGVVGGRFRATYHATSEPALACPGTLAYFLHERYRFFLRRGPALVMGEVRHESWPLQRLSIAIEENTLGDLAHHDLSRPPDVAFFTRGLRVRASSVLPFRTRS